MADLTLSWLFHFFSPREEHHAARSRDDDDNASVPRETPSLERALAHRALAHRTLVDRVRAGDDHAFEQLFLEFYPPLCTYAESLGHTSDAAEDIVDELFVKLWMSRQTWEVRGTLASYLYVATRHQAQNYSARTRSRVRALERVALERGSMEPAVVSSENIEQILDADDRTAIIDAAVRALPAKARQVFLLYYRDDLSYAEIAATLGIARKTVETQLARALKQLSARLRHKLR